MWAPGARFGKYKLKERLGKGGMAETWRAELQAAEGVRRDVVIKRVLPSFADNAEFIDAFIQEAKITASLSHGNVAQVFDFGQLTDGSHFIAMELIDGVSLDRVLKRGVSKGYWHMPYPIAALIALEVAKALDHVHTRRGPKGPLNIVHRDISPDNIIVGLGGETKLVDFGVAKSVLEGRPETEAGVVKGKSIYFSPEQAAGERVDFKTDIYALGVVLYRLVTGRKAFDGSGFKVLQAVASGSYVPARRANPDLPEELTLIVETAMAREKGARFANTLELVEALQACVRSLAPRAGVHWIRGWVRWLYAPELQKRGDSVDLQPGFADQIAAWLPAPRSDPEQEHALSAENPHPMGTVASRPLGSRPANRGSIESEIPFVWTPKLKRQALIGAGVGLAAVVALVAFNHDARDSETEAQRARRIAEAMRMKPIERPAGMPAPSPQSPAQPPDPRLAVREPTPRPPEPQAPSPPEPAAPETAAASYDAESAPLEVTLGPAHRVLLDGATPLPGSSGTVSGLKMLPRQAPMNQLKLMGTNLEINVPGMTPGGVPVAELPPLLFMPGKKPSLEVALGRARWSAADSRVVVLVGSNLDSPAPGPFQLDLNGKPTMPTGWLIVVDPNDRFTIRSLAGRASWRVSVTPRASDGKVVVPILLVAQGDAPRLDGKKMPGGYGVLSPGRHQLAGATSAWLTLPALPSMELAQIDVAFEP